MSELKGICPKCGAGYSGWALANLTEQKCAQCGSALEIPDKRASSEASDSSGTARTYKTGSNPKRRYKGGSTVIN